MLVAIERTLKSVRNVVQPAVTRRSHRLGSSQTPAPRTANEEERCVWTGTQLCQIRRELLDEGYVGHAFGKALPLNRNNLFPNWAQIRKTDKGPFRPRSDIYEYGVRLLLEPPPDFLDLYIPYLGPLL